MTIVLAVLCGLVIGVLIAWWLWARGRAGLSFEEVAEMEARIEAEEGRSRAAAAERDAQVAKATELRTAVAQREEAIGERDARLQTQQSALATRQAELDGARSELAAAAAEVEDLGARVGWVTAELDAEQRRTAAATAAADEAEARRTDLDVRLAAASDEVTDLRTDLQACRGWSIELEHRIHRLREEHEDATGEALLARERVEDLAAQLARQLEITARLEAEVDELRARLDGRTGSAAATETGTTGSPAGDEVETAGAPSGEGATHPAPDALPADGSAAVAASVAAPTFETVELETAPADASEDTEAPQPRQAADVDGAAQTVLDLRDAPVTLTEVGIPAASHHDDLKVVRGIGPKMEATLNSLGITAWEQLAALDADDVARVADRISTFPGRIERDGWVEQAAELVARFPDPADRPTRETYLHRSAEPS